MNRVLRILIVLMILTTNIINVPAIVAVADNGSSVFVKNNEINKSFFTDIEDSLFRYDIELLANLGIIKENSDEFKPEETVSRGKFAEIISRCMGIEEPSSFKGNIFPDVNDDNIESNYIGSAVTMGLMNGYPDGTFRPEQEITYNQAVTVIVNALGYKIYAEQAGQYPNGWIVTASNLGILKRTQQIGEGLIKKEVMAALISNALEVDIMVRVGYGNNSKYEIQKGNNLLTEYLDIYKIQGKVNANYYTTLAGDSTLKKDEIQIGDTVFKTGTPNTAYLIGRDVIAYIQEDKNIKNQWEALFIEESERTSNTLVVDAKDILSKTTISELFYIDDEGNEEDSVSINEQADLIYNGKVKINWTKEDLVRPTGEVTLIDNDNDGRYDVILTDEYKSLIVKAVNSEQKTIYFDNPNQKWSSIKVDPNELGKKVLLVNSDGSTFSIEQCNAWDILSVFKSEDSNVIRIIRSVKNITGIIEEMDYSNNEVVINGENYKISDSFLSFPEYNLLGVNTQGVFYLDYRNEIAAIDYNAVKGMQYGYLVSIGSIGGLNDAPQLKIFNANGLMMSYDTENKIHFNGNVVNNTVIFNSEKIIKDTSVSNKSKEAIRQLILYGLSSEGKLNRLETSEDGREMNAIDRQNKFSLDEIIDLAYYRGGNMKMFASRYLVKDDAKIFIVPDTDYAADSAYVMISPADLINGLRYAGIRVYDVSLDNEISAVTIRRTPDIFLRNTSSVAVVTRINKGIDESGNDVTMIYAYPGGRDGGEEVILTVEASYTGEAVFRETVLTDILTESETVDVSGNTLLKATITPDKIRPGDVIQYEADSNSSIIDMRVLFRANTPAEGERVTSTSASPTKDNCYSPLYYAYSTVDGVLKNGVRYKVPSASDSSELFERVQVFHANAKIYKYDIDNRKIRMITENEIFENDKMFIQVNSSNTNLMVIY
jgi:hypothetical protein